MLFGVLFALIGFVTISLVGIGFGLFFALLGGGLWYQTLKQTGTRLYLTSYRLIRTRHGAITNQISRQIFRGKNLAAFLRVSGYTAYGRNNGAYRVETFHVDILDPNSGNVLMNLGQVPAPTVNVLETISQVVYCQYCGRSNPPSNNTCSECGATL
jgi:zinc-ribbon domain